MTKVPERGSAKPGTAIHVPEDTGRIERLAYSYWEGRGYRGDSSEEDWLRAEQDLSSSGPGVERYFFFPVLSTRTSSSSPRTTL